MLTNRIKSMKINRFIIQYTKKGVNKLTPFMYIIAKVHLKCTMEYYLTINFVLLTPKSEVIITKYNPLFRPFSSTVFKPCPKSSC